MNGVFATPAMFKLMRDRTQQWIDTGLPGCDKIMIPLVKGIQATPGLTTIYCCEGHIEMKVWDNFYMMMSVTPGGFERLQLIFTTLMDKILSQADHKNKDAIRPNDIGMTFSQRMAPVDEPDYWAPVVNLNASFRNNIQKELFFKLFNETLDELLPKLDPELDVTDPQAIYGDGSVFNKIPGLDEPAEMLYNDTISASSVSKGLMKDTPEVKNDDPLKFSVISGNLDKIVSSLKVITDPNDLELGMHYFVRLKSKPVGETLHLVCCTTYKEMDDVESKKLSRTDPEVSILSPYKNHPGSMQHYHIVGPVEFKPELPLDYHLAIAERARDLIDQVTV